MIALDAGFAGMHPLLRSPTNTAAVTATAKASGGGVGLVFRCAAEAAKPRRGVDAYPLGRHQPALILSALNGGKRGHRHRDHHVDLVALLFSLVIFHPRGPIKPTLHA